MAVLQINEDAFEAEVLQSEKPVLVDFWAGWCGPCKMLSPVVEKVSEEVDSVKFVGIDVDSAERLAIKYGISSIPCLILFKNGEEADRSVGFVPADKLKSFLGV
jgi:thioredoxin 1